MAQAKSYGAQLEAADSLLEPNLSQNQIFHSSDAVAGQSPV